MRPLLFLLATGLLASCGGEATIENAANEAQNLIDNAAENGAEPDMAGNTSDDEATPQQLPLRLGFYVSTDTPCDQASNATLMLLRRDGYGGGRYSCTFGAIDQQGPSTYRVSEICTQEGAGFRPEDQRRVTVATYEVAGDGYFTAKRADGWQSSSRYCEQSSLPEPWRDNDISDVIGNAAEPAAD